MTGSPGPSFPRYGELWMVDLDPVIGSEIQGGRPALIVSNDANNQFSATVTVLPLTSQPARRQYPDEVLVPEGTANLPLASRIKANMIRTIDKARLRAVVGQIPVRYYPQLQQALRVHLNIPR